MSSEIKTIRRSKRRSSTFKHPWMTPELYQLTEKRRKLLRLSQNQPLNESLQLKYNKLRNFVSVQVNKTKADYFKREFMGCTNSQIQKWKCIKKFVGGENSEDDQIFLKSEGRAITSQKEAAEKFNFFINIGKIWLKSYQKQTLNFLIFLIPNEIPPTFMFEEIDTHDILPIIEKLDTKKATGNDQISTRAIKDNKMVFAPILVFLINFVIESSIFPDCLKIAWVKPIFKKGDKYNAITLAPFQF